MRTHEIAGPEVTQVTGQLRIPKDVTISKHIAQFDTWCSSDTQMAAVKGIAKKIGVNYETIEKHTWAEHNLLWYLHAVGNTEAARAIALDRKLVEDPIIHDLLVRNTALMIHNDPDIRVWGHNGINDTEISSAITQMAGQNVTREALKNAAKKLEGDLKGLHLEKSWVINTTEK